MSSNTLSKSIPIYWFRKWVADNVRPSFWERQEDPELAASLDKVAETLLLLPVEELRDFVLKVSEDETVRFY